jgi:hypothetical protein
MYVLANCRGPEDELIHLRFDSKHTGVTCIVNLQSLKLHTLATKHCYLQNNKTFFMKRFMRRLKIRCEHKTL